VGNVAGYLFFFSLFTAFAAFTAFSRYLAKKSQQQAPQKIPRYFPATCRGKVVKVVKMAKTHAGHDFPSTTFASTFFRPRISAHTRLYCALPPLPPFPPFFQLIRGNVGWSQGSARIINRKVTIINPVLFPLTLLNIE